VVLDVRPYARMYRSGGFLKQLLDGFLAALGGGRPNGLGGELAGQF
jgi:hypothetical protein